MTPIRGGTGEGPLRRLDRILIDEAAAVEDSLSYHRNQVQCPVYTSVDVRRNRTKAAVVDANAFPAGFNNLAARSHAQAAEAIQNYMQKTYPDATSVVVLGEDHTRNKWYFQNLKALGELLGKAGLKVTLASLNEEMSPKTQVETALGEKITVHHAHRDGDALVTDAGVADVIILNNDLSTGTPDALDGLHQPITPPPIMGWHRRSKSEHFRIVTELAEQLGDDIGFDPWLITAAFDCADDVDFKARQNLDDVAKRIDGVLTRVQAKYDEYDVEEEPTVFVKADSGTYGMGVMTADSGEAFLRLNAKAREKMDKGKGRQKTSRVIIQEGVPTAIHTGDAGAAEPVLYMVCGQVVGGFYRVHEKKGPEDNLNTPGSRFVPFLTQGDGEPGPDEGKLDPVTSHVYQILGELASIATGYELKFAGEPGKQLPSYP